MAVSRRMGALAVWCQITAFGERVELAPMVEGLGTGLGMVVGCGACGGMSSSKVQVPFAGLCCRRGV
jgi:hypothetical protein